MTKKYMYLLKDLADGVLADNVDVAAQVAIRPLAKAMMVKAREQGLSPCYQTCKNHIAQAVRRARGEFVKSNWGGPRPGAGKPRKEKDNAPESAS